MMGTPEYEPEAVAQPSTAVVDEIASAEDVSPPNVPVPLYDSVDPDALDALVSSADDVSVTFSYFGYQVTVDGDGDVSLEA